MSPAPNTDDWPTLQEAAKAIQAYADSRWPDLNITVGMRVEMDMFALEVEVAKHGVSATYRVLLKKLQTLPSAGVREWVIARISAAVELPKHDAGITAPQAE